MPPSGDQGRRPRTSANSTGTTVFKYGNTEVNGDNEHDISVYYWSESDRNIHNASGDLEQERLAGFTAGQQQRQLQQLATSSIKESSVHSAAIVLTIAGMYARNSNSDYSLVTKEILMNYGSGTVDTRSVS